MPAFSASLTVDPIIFVDTIVIDILRSAAFSTLLSPALNGEKHVWPCAKEFGTDKCQCRAD